ncbi:MAG: VOC family protein [Candidatus Binataceae bacterium]
MIKISGLEHVSWAAAELDGAQSILALFGLRPTGHEEIRNQGVVSNYFESDCGVRFEVIRPLGVDSQLGRFLENRGPGLHHVCFQVDNLDQACGEIVSAGGQLVGPPFEDSRGRHAFVHPKSTGGVLIGMVELHPHLKR